MSPLLNTGLGTLAEFSGPEGCVFNQSWIVLHQSDCKFNGLSVGDDEIRLYGFRNRQIVKSEPYPSNQTVVMFKQFFGTLFVDCFGSFSHHV